VFVADATGFVFTTTVVVAVAVQLLALVTVTVYTPAIAVVAPGRVGFCRALVKDDGPDQLYEVPPDELSVMVAPSQYGPVLDAVAVGFVFTTTTVEFVPVQPPAPVTVTLYVPAIAVVAPGRVGF
jgi:hypothetical protein